MKKMQLSDMELAMAAGGTKYIGYDPTLGLTWDNISEKFTDSFREFKETMEKKFGPDVVLYPQWSKFDMNDFLGKYYSLKFHCGGKD